MSSTLSIKSNRQWLLLALLVLIFDQISKYFAVELLVREGQIHPFLPYFHFTLLYNYGAAFSFLSDAGGWQRWFLSGLTLLVSGLLVVWILRLDGGKKLELTGLSLILGGALGNLWDRLSLGYVVDFVDWFYPAFGLANCLPLFYFRADLQSCHWPAFNLADAAILLGVTLLIVDTLFTQPAFTQPAPTKPASTNHRQQGDNNQ